MRRTVARVREQAGHADVMFFESPRIFRLPASHPGYAAALRVLQAAASSGAAVHVEVEPADDGVIAAVVG